MSNRQRPVKSLGPRNYRPTELPELREEMRRWSESQHARDYWTHAVERGDGGSSSGVGATALRMAELYYVEPDMADLAVQASANLPDFALEPEDLPAMYGLLYSPRPFWEFKPVTEAEGPTLIFGIAWAPAPGVTTEDGAPVRAMLMSFLTDREADFAVRTDVSESVKTWARRRLPRLHETATGVSIWEFGEAFPEDREMVRDAGLDTSPALILKAMWLLMQQPIASVEAAPFSASETLRLSKRDIEPGPVRLIRLRRTSAPRLDSDYEGSGREFHHQWVVRGHWRQQWYPGRGVHRPIWISDHIKGPEGAPLLGGEKVHHWKR